ncbi:phage tail tape measure protein [Paenibacillus sp. FSL P2-0089]|uniref:phage tail tape measure protein n=1 Tax=Paenibacillus sp. FSL P2-0089 TaxID=2954526 RepID=UPI00315A69E0
MAGGIIGSLMYAVGFKFNSKGIDDADSKVGKLTKGVIGLGAAGGAALVGIGAAAISAASNFESAMSKVQLTTGQTTDQMEATRGIAMNLYNDNFGENWEDLGGKISDVARATGLTGNALETASREAMLYSDKFDGDVAESIAGVSVAMKNFGVTSTQAFNLLTQGQTNGTNTQGDLLDSINEYSQAFASMGFTMEDTMGYLQNGLAAGARNTDLLGDAMNEFSILSIEAGGTAEASFQALGLDANKMMKTFSKGGPAAKQSFRDIVSMISDIEDPVQQNTIGVGLFGTMFEELGVKAFSALDDVNTSFDQNKDSAANLFNSFTSIGDSFQYFKRHIETGILIPIGQKLLPYLNMFGSWISSHQSEIAAFGAMIGNGLGVAIEKVSGWVKAAIPYLQEFGTQATQAFTYLVDKGKELWTSIQPIVTLIGTQLVAAAVALWPEIQNIAGKMAEVGKAIWEWEPFIPIISGIAAILLTYKTAMIAVSTATKIAGVATKVWSGITKAFTAVQTAFNAVIAMNPIALVVLALVGLGVALTVAYKRSDKFRAFIDKMWSGIKTATMATLNFFKVTVPKYFMIAFNAVTGFLKKWGVTILAVIGGPITLIALLVYKNWDKIKAVTVAVFTAIWNWLKSAWGWISSTVSGAASGIWNAIKGAWEKVKSTTTNIFTAVWNKIKSIWGSITGSVSGAVSNVWGAIKGAWNRVFDTTNSLMTKVWNKITGIWGQIVSGITGIGTKLLKAVTDMWGTVTDFFSGINLYQIGADIIQGLINGVGSMASDLMGKVEEMGVNFGKKVKEFFGFKASASVSVETTDAVLGASPINGSHANGLAKVPWDGYIAQLHKGERVLTAEENEEYSRYTPETAPARTTNNRSKTEFNPVFNISVQGSADNQTLANLRETIRREMQEVFESYMRSGGLDGA